MPKLNNVLKGVKGVHMLVSSTWFEEWFRTTKVFVCVRYAICASREFNARWRNSVELERDVKYIQLTTLPFQQR